MGVITDELDVGFWAQRNCDFCSPHCAPVDTGRAASACCGGAAAAPRPLTGGRAVDGRG
eukprot:CAMPEP_0206145456 /NCGR_PEP_ID=MMETSP1473-20131121/27409_1 /ASSEMBLY_ACC=CAM_ASM_001109 /TAXON_ID=1461547 /ORGANISM="Stichococcus sp, Strain RCC1054" /LENGTH=58 /DNA_ID=CAMNT_0053541679 /DNA_START=1245 /DNA_END=1417 /DNA_ORIENTATION=-